MLSPIDTNSVIDACRQIDFASLPNIDAIFFEQVRGRIQEVFDRTRQVLSN